MAAKKYIVKNTTILHNGKVFKSGSEINLDDKTAEKLVDVLTPVVEKPQKAENKAPQKSENKTETKSNENQTTKDENGGNE